MNGINTLPINQAIPYNFGYADGLKLKRNNGFVPVAVFFNAQTQTASTYCAVNGIELDQWNDYRKGFIDGYGLTVL